MTAPKDAEARSPSGARGPRAGENALPSAAFRVGVTGMRHLEADQGDRLRREIAVVLACVVRAARRGGGRQEARVAVVSPLAEGADRLVAEEGLRAGFALVAPLPFAIEDYVCDFPATADAFRRLLAAAVVIELAGVRGAREAESYEAVGRFVVVHCDVLIAIWDGAVTGKRGGTAEIMRFAADAGIPMVWIDAQLPRPSRWLVDHAAWERRADSESGDAAVALAAYLDLPR